ncbi:MAG: RDD family protein [Gammaproteobacteria bacterium]|nr:RDD family protein [Gammaproteobacteria bacterium]
MTTESETQDLPHAGLFKRLATVIYDGLIVVAILFLASAIAMAVVGAIMGSEAITEQQILVSNPIYSAWLVVCWFSYYAWCWRKGGQTLGMKAWRLKLITNDNIKITYSNALLRFFSSLLGLAHLWALFPEKRGWQDIISQTNIIVLKMN